MDQLHIDRDRLPVDYAVSFADPALDISFHLKIENSQTALRNRATLDAAQLYCVNIISNLGVGATSLIERTIAALKPTLPIAVIEGDLIAALDAERLQALSTPVVELSREHRVHMNADLLADGLAHLERDGDLSRFDLLLVEHVGDMICPAVYSLGEHARVVVVDVTEDETSPLSNPLLFHCAHCIVVNKLDLAPDAHPALDQLIANIHAVNPHVPVVPLSAQSGEGIDQWLEWLHGQMQAFSG